jgi:hypothetical protein
MKKHTILFAALIVVLFVSACSTTNAATPNVTESRPTIASIVSTQAPTTPATGVSAPPTTAPAQNQPAETKTDGQGMVTVELTPENLNNPGETLVFDVSMNTHSVNLGMDLSKLATLTTDTNHSVAASGWDGPKEGGHHVSGKLTFPATQDGKSILAGAVQVTVTITGVDAPSRVFTWQVSK